MLLTVKKLDCLQWLIEVSRTKGESSVVTITQKTLGFIFAFAHQMAMVGTKFSIVCIDMLRLIFQVAHLRHPRLVRAS